MLLSYVYLHTINFIEAMKNIIGSLFLLLSVFCLFACSKDEELIEEKQYEFSSIMWALQEGDGEELFEIKTPEQVFRNTGNTTKDIVINSSEKVEESSQFFIDENILPYLPEEEITVAFPVYSNCYLLITNISLEKEKHLSKMKKHLSHQIEQLQKRCR